MDKLRIENSRGFSILELMIGMAVFLIISGALLIGMGQMQSQYRTNEVQTQMQQQLRSTMDLMAAEIGQAGLQASVVEGDATGTGGANITAPYKLGVISTTNALVNATITPASNGVFAAYIGQWLVVDAGVNQEPPVQVANIGATTIQAIFHQQHLSGVTPAYPMGIFPHGILAGSVTTIGTNTYSDPSSANPTGGSKLAMYGEINGSGNGLWAVEYVCPATFPGPLVRKMWNLSSYRAANNPPLAAAISYNLIDNVTTCYFCWPGVTTTAGVYSSTNNPNCPASATPDQVTLLGGDSSSAILMITQVSFTVAMSEQVVTAGSKQSTPQTITVSNSASNIQPRNMVAADGIFNTAVQSAINVGACTSPCNASTNAGAYATYLNGELQPDPPAVVYITTAGLW